MYKSYKVPISIKGLVFDEGKVWLRKNERSEWELPGGKLDEGEQPEETVIRELREELGLVVEVIDIIQSHLYIIETSKDENAGVLVVTYLCKPLKKSGDFEIEGEAGKAEFKKFLIGEIKELNMPQFYKDAITKVSEN